MQKKIMVLTESNKIIEKEPKETRDVKENEAMADNSSSLKLISCEEFEKSIGAQLTDTMEMKKSTEELKEKDPAIVSCSTSTKLTRYSKKELMDLKFSKLSTIMPECLARPEIHKLAIAYGTENNENLATQGNGCHPYFNLRQWNPEIYEFVRNFKQATGENPMNIRMNPFYMNPPQQYLDAEQAAYLDKISPYDRTNFFDPTRQLPKMGVNSLQGRPNGYPNQNRNNSYQRKSANEQFDGNFRASYSTERIRVDERGEVVKEVRPRGNEHESTPEWFTTPATVDDIVDLRGFEEGDGENHPQANGAQPTLEKGYGTPSLAYRRSGYCNPNRNGTVRYGGNNNNNINMNNGNNGGNGNYNNAPNNNQRFRNPLHFQKPPHMGGNNWQNPANPYFELWQRGRYGHGGQVNFQNLLTSPMSTKVPDPMEDNEKRIQAQNYLASLILNSQNAQVPPQMQAPLPIHQFFQQWPTQVQGTTIRPDGSVHRVPTQAEMQVHTNEIMRNAILRKNQQQEHFQK